MTIADKKNSAEQSARVFLIALTLVLFPITDSVSPAFAKPDPTAVKTIGEKKSGTQIDQMSNKAQEIEKNIAAERKRQEELKRREQILSKEIQNLQTDMVDTAGRAQDQEEALNKLESSLKDLGSQKEKAEKNLLKSHDSLSRVLGAMLRLKRQPPQALLAIPQTPAETGHTIILLRQMMPELDGQVEKLRVELDEIANVEKTIEEKHKEVIDRSDKLKSEKSRLENLVKRRMAAQTANQREQAAQEAKISSLAGQAADLRDLIAKLESERKKKAAQAARPKFPAKPKQPGKEVASIGGIPLPAKGKITTGFGEINNSGATSKGVVIETRPEAQVVSPYAGEVVYAGQFRSYGLMLIIEVADGYHIMLSNLGRIDCALGQNLVAGEPVAAMPGANPPPKLYVEFRKNGQPVAPQSWLMPNS